MESPLHDRLVDIASTLDEVAGAMRRIADTGRTTDSDTRTGTDRLPLDVMAEQLLQQRHARSRFLPPSLFHEPAWEILLSLFVAQRRGKTLNVKHLAEEVDAPITTSQRWIDTLAHMKLVQRLTDANDRRRIELSLSEPAMLAIERYLQWHLDQSGHRSAVHPSSALPRVA